MGNDFSSPKPPLYIKNPQLVSVLLDPNQLSYQRLYQIYQNVTQSKEETVPQAGGTPALLRSQCDGALSPYLDEVLFEHWFCLNTDVSNDLFKAFDREEDGVVKWKSVLAGLTLCGNATVQQKCDLILCIVSIRLLHQTILKVFLFVLFCCFFKVFKWDTWITNATFFLSTYPIFL